MVFYYPFFSDRFGTDYKTEIDNPPDQYLCGSFYSLPLGGVNADVGFHVFNLLDTKHITDATDGGDHTAADAFVWMGLERRWVGSFNISF